MKHIAFRILAGLVLLAAIGGIAFFAYNAGLAHGAALDLKPVIVQSETQPQAPMPGYGFHGMVFHHTMPFFGFGCFGILIPLFLLFLAFGAMRHLFWGHRLHVHGPWGHRGPWSEGVPPMFVEWHRRAHADPPAADDTEKK